jgi:hypothetical protein
VPNEGVNARPRCNVSGVVANYDHSD